MDGFGEGIKEKVEKSINISGYPLELFVSSIVSKNHLSWNNEYYFDFDEKKSRTIDLHVTDPATAATTDLHLSVDLAIECKKSTNTAWVFFEKKEPSVPNFMGQVIDHYNISQNDYEHPTNLFTLNLSNSTHYGKTLENNMIAHSYDVVKLGQKIGDDSTTQKPKDTIFEAANQVIKYTTYNLEKRTKNIRNMYKKQNIYPIYILYYPIVVFDGPLYTGELHGEKIQLSESEHVLLKYQFQPRYTQNPQTFFIDIVHKSYFSKFFQLIENEVNQLGSNIDAKKIEIKTAAENLKLRKLIPL